MKRNILTQTQRVLLAALLLAGMTAKAHARARIVFSDPQEETYVVKDMALADAVKAYDKARLEYRLKTEEHGKPERINQLQMEPVSDTVKQLGRLDDAFKDARDAAAKAAAIGKSMEQARRTEAAVKTMLSAIIANTAGDRLIKVMVFTDESFEDMVHVKLRKPTEVEADLEVFPPIRLPR